MVELRRTSKNCRRASSISWGRDRAHSLEDLGAVRTPGLCQLVAEHVESHLVHDALKMMVTTLGDGEIGRGV
jgi:hypothetical protein